MRYYSLDNILSKNCDYNFIVSGRGPGKSTAIVNMLIDECEKGNEFVRIGRYDWEVSRTLMAQWFNEVNRAHALEKLNGTVKYEGGRWLLLDADDPGLESVMGHMVTLNNQDTFKSASYDNVTNIVYEEFAMLSDRDYMVGEVEAFLSAVSTIVRRRQNVKVWFIGNTLSKHNPFFEFFGIDIDRMGIKPGQVRQFRCAGYNGNGATIAFEFADMAESDYMELSPLMRIGGNVTATTGLYEIEPSVSDYELRVAGISDDMFKRVLPTVDGIYLGNGSLAECLVTRKEVFDNLNMLVVREIEPGIEKVLGGRWLNLSGDFNPRLTVNGFETTRTLRCVSPFYLYADDSAMKRLQALDARCVHAYSSDELRYRWRNFVDMWNYEKGSI